MYVTKISHKEIIMCPSTIDWSVCVRKFEAHRCQDLKAEWKVKVKVRTVTGPEGPRGGVEV
jgi:hypothetical protein